jgi:toxin ParE1/3/4
MAEYRLSGAADADIESLYLYGLETFGMRQAEAYLARLRYVLDMLAAFPRMGRSLENLRGGFFRFPCESHVIFYTIEADHITIQRVLYGRADFATKI